MSRSTTGEGCRIGCGDHDTTYARVQNYFRARWRLAKMVARLEGHVKRRSSRAVAGCPQRHYLGVGLAETRVKSLADDNAVANDNSADHRVRRCLTPALLGEGYRAAHELRVALVIRTRIELRPIRRFWNRLLACH